MCIGCLPFAIDKHSRFYLNCVILVILFIYVTAVLLPWVFYMSFQIENAIFLLIIHILLFLLAFSLYKVAVSDPGRVPTYWGLHFNDNDQKKRRYCLVCHVFKPERCHHCSTCDRCVLNMDHHCPWINNCVGFHNRKFFLLMLFYVNTSSFTILCGFIKVLLLMIDDIEICFDGLVNCDKNWVMMGFILIGSLFDITLFIVLVIFFSTHVNFVLRNYTTIENLDRIRNKSSLIVYTYDNGLYRNWTQVFGRNPWLWFLPIYGDSGQPAGDGVMWKSKESGL